MTPVHDEDGITLYHGDVLRWLAFEALPGDVMVTDPPYGIAYESGHFGTLARSIAGDEDTAVRDAVLDVWGSKPALVFGTWRAQRPAATRMLLVWDTKGALGMGDLSLPWKPAHQEVYVLGSGFAGRRTSDVLTFAPGQEPRSRITHLCPYREERDVGTVELTFSGPAPELHGLADRLAVFAEVKITHEELTEMLAVETGASVVTKWITAGLEVEVQA